MSSSTDILHFGANERRSIMLGKLGGKKVLRQAVDRFYDRQLVDGRHARLFDDGLCAEHFDIVMDHFRCTLEEMKVDEEVIKEAMDVILPVRYCFEKGAADARKRKRARAWRRNSMMVAVCTGAAYFAAKYVTRQRHKKA